MISFTLSCSNKHRFDGWFRGSDDFDKQRDAGLLTCPVCGDADITKALMAPNVSTSRGKAKAADELCQAMAQAQATVEAENAKPAVDGEVLPPGDKQVAAAMPPLKDAPAPVKAYVEAVRKLRAEVEANSEDVGSRFAEEARKMHHGETEERAIRGQASLEEAVELDDEGIDIFMLPDLPEDAH